MAAPDAVWSVSRGRGRGGGLFDGHQIDVCILSVVYITLSVLYFVLNFGLSYLTAEYYFA